MHPFVAYQHQQQEDAKIFFDLFMDNLPDDVSNRFKIEVIIVCNIYKYSIGCSYSARPLWAVV